LSFTKFTARAAPFFSSFYHFLNENYKIFSIFKWLHFSGAGQIDEGELGFHLQWQKEYVLKLIEIVPLIFKRGTEIQLIFATHSPISLSDLPNEHITFLKKDDNRNAIVQDQMDKSTFSANIHDILKNSFFLTDGFMGSFAQHKINALISELRVTENPNLQAIKETPDQLWEDNASYDYAKKLISNIDEPILRMKLEELFSAKYHAQDKTIRDIDAQIAYLENRKKQIQKNDYNQR